MFTNLIGLLFILTIAGVAFWSLTRIWLNSDKRLKWGGSVALGLVGVLASIIAILAGLGMWTVYAPRGNEIVEVTIEGTPQQIARGEMLVGSLCSSCHSTNHSLPPTGNTNMLADIPMPLGETWPPNLTPAGRIDDWTDGELQRAIREGTNPDGHRLPVMSAQTFRNFSQEDLDSIVAYLRSLEPIENNLGEPKTRLSILAMVMTTLGALPLKDLPESNVPPPAVPIEPTARYGEYIAAFTDCVVCHGENFVGGTSSILPNGPDLRHVKDWQPEQFVHAMRTGITPDGRIMSDDMPWLAFGKMHDVELIALYEYLQLLD